MAEKKAQKNISKNFGDDQDDSASSLSQDDETENQHDTPKEDAIDAKATEENDDSADDGFAPDKSPEPEKKNNLKE